MHGRAVNFILSATDRHSVIEQPPASFPPMLGEKYGFVGTVLQSSELQMQ
jgi:hypothetical protein